MTKRPTIHDVARRAGVSKSLVANVFRSAEGVSEKRREAVLAAAEELGYTPNTLARALRAPSGGIVGIVVADFHNPLFTAIAEETRQILAARDIFCFVATASIVDGPNGKIVDRAPINHLIDLRPSSLFIVGSLPELSAFAKLPTDMPVVVASSSSAELPNSVAVRTNENAAMSLICSHLRDLGHRTVAYLGPENRPVAADRRDAFLARAKRSRIKATCIGTGLDVDEAAGFDAAQRALALHPRPTALVCFNDNMAFGAQSAVARAVATGEPDVAITGYDNTYIAQLDRIALTSIDQDVSEIAKQATALLTDKELFRAASGNEILVEPQIAVRASTLAALRDKN
jgi:DNA-binding LacI/PurR family transcriptional regulator